MIYRLPIISSNPKIMNKYLYFFTLFFVSSLTLCFSQTQLPSFFSDNMVLQQQDDVAIWGTDKPEVKVHVYTTWGVEASTTSDENGKWQMEIATPKASFDNEVVTIKGSSTLVLKNVLIGEVWFASGQSNMEMAMKDTNKPVVNNYDAYINTSNNSFIRLFNTERSASLSPQQDVTGFWASSTMESASSFSAVGYMFARQLFDELQVPIGIIEAAWGGTSIVSWLPKSIMEKHPNYKIPDVLPEDIDKQKRPTTLYNAMIHPFKNYSIKGFLWYQGEANRRDYKSYKGFMHDLVNTWRSQWLQDELPFYFVQIAPYDYNKRYNRKSDSYGANRVREAQVKAAQQISNSGVVITTDVGQCDEIHPPEKEIIANRLANWALTKDYGFSELPYRSPEYKSVEFKKGKAKIEFNFYGKDKNNLLLDSSRKLKDFQIAGADKVFYDAEVIVGKKQKSITIYSDKVANPVAVRYGFVDCLEGSLFSKAGLPVSPFRSDDWSE